MEDEKGADVTQAILRSARTGEVGDGKIFVFELDFATGIHTGDGDSQAL